MAQVIPLQAVPNQQTSVILAGQYVQLAVYARGSVGNQQLYVDTNVNGQDISVAVLARNLVNLVPSSYFGFSGFLLFLDTMGFTDPVYTGLGSRYQLFYLQDQADLAANFGVTNVQQ